MGEKLERMEKRQSVLESENTTLRQKLKEEKEKTPKIEEGKIQELRNTWKEEQKIEQESFRDILKKQLEQYAEETVIKVIKQKQGLVRDTVEKKKMCSNVRSERKEKSCLACEGKRR